MDDTLLPENVVWTIVGNICTHLNSMSRIFAYQAHQGTFQWYHVNFSHESCHYIITVDENVVSRAEFLTN